MDDTDIANLFLYKSIDNRYELIKVKVDIIDGLRKERKDE